MWLGTPSLDHAGPECEIPSPQPDNETLPDLGRAFSFSLECSNRAPITCCTLLQAGYSELPSHSLGLGRDEGSAESGIRLRALQGWSGKAFLLPLHQSPPRLQAPSEISPPESLSPRPQPEPVPLPSRHLGLTPHTTIPLLTEPPVRLVSLSAVLGALGVFRPAAGRHRLHLSGVPARAGAHSGSANEVVELGWPWRSSICLAWSTMTPAPQRNLRHGTVWG